MIEIILITILAIWIIIELITKKIVLNVNKQFQWLIVKKDEEPALSKIGLEKFFKHGYDSELGWIRKPNTSHKETGKYGKTLWSIDEKGARKNSFAKTNNTKISCYGDSFTFCRQVNDNETWEYHLSELLKTNVKNFGVGNYGIDQALLRLKREFPKNPTEFVVLGVVPDTISRILSMWKHYYEYGNTFGFKPKFKFNEGKLELLKNPIDEEEKFFRYRKKIPYIQQNDFFYKNKFKNEIIHFPYSLTILKNFSRNFEIIKWVNRIEKRKTNNMNVEEIAWNPMEVIMKINLEWRIKLFSNEYATILLEEIIKEFVNYSILKKFTPIFIWLPQKDDILFIKQNYHFYENFNKKIQKMNDLTFIDVTKYLIQEKNIEQLYSDNNDYGGHYSKEGNGKIAEIIFSELKNKKLI